MPDADDIALADEEMRLAEGDAAFDQLRGAGDDEQRVAILLDLRPLVRMLGILDRQIVQVELRLHAQQQLAVGLEQADPDDMALALSAHSPASSIGNVGDAPAGRVDAGGDDARMSAQRRA